MVVATESVLKMTSEGASVVIDSWGCEEPMVSPSLVSLPHTAASFTAVNVLSVEAARPERVEWEGGTEEPSGRT